MTIEGVVDIGRRRWLMLGLGTLAQTASCAFLYGLPYLLPMIRRTEHLSLAQAGALIAAPTIGVIVALIPWGAAADRFGERIVMALGLGAAGALLLLADFTHDVWSLGAVLALAGAGGASVNAASGRVVLGWFPAHQRGLAMGARQMAQPLGLMLAAVSLPPIAGRWDFRAALIALGCFALVTAALVAVLVIDPVRKAGKKAETPSASPYRTPALWRVHGASALLVVPQFVTSAFALEYLVSQRDWSSTQAGRLLAIVQLCGALGRLGVGVWSDRVGSRLRPMRQIAVASAVAMLALAAGTAGHSVLAIVALGAASVISVTDNGLGFTATAEIAGPMWAGRALGAQNTGQNIAAFATPPVFGALIGGPGYVTAFVIAAIFPALGVLSVPVRSGEARGDRGSDG
ncbi:MAG TPA: MFS transporter [Mycobacteriales bacterium]|nr:MFS transporter [Mycobacteriales bacterium]